MKYNLIPFYDQIILKHGNLSKVGISLEICKNEINNLSEKKYIEFKTKIENQRNKISYELNASLSIKKETSQKIIQNRSIDIIKKKFNLYDKEFKEILEKNTEKSKFKISINKFIPVIKELFHKMNLSFNEYLNPSEILNYTKSQTILEEYNLINKLFLFMFENRKEYNQQFKKQMNLIDDIDEKIYGSEKLENKVLPNVEKSNKESIIEKVSEVTIPINEEIIFPNSVPYLYFDSIPTILFDFISKNRNVFIIDKNEEFKNFLKESFDKQLAFSLDNKKSIKIKVNPIDNKINDLIQEKTNLNQNLSYFQDKLLKSTEKSPQVIENTVKKIKENLQIIDNEIEIIEKNKSSKEVKFKEKLIPKLNKEKSIPSKDEIRLKSLREIFTFYSRLHYSTKKKETFDNIKEVAQKLELSEYLKFWSDFSIPLSKNKILNILKNRPNMKDLSFEDFVISINDISVKINEKNIKNLEKRINILREGKLPVKFIKHTEKIAKSNRLDNLLNKNNKSPIKEITSNSKSKKNESNKSEEIKTDHKKMILNQEILKINYSIENEELNKNFNKEKNNNKLFKGKNKGDKFMDKHEVINMKVKENIKNKEDVDNSNHKEIEHNFKQESHNVINETPSFFIKAKSPKHLKVPVSSKIKIINYDMNTIKDKNDDLREILSDDNKKQIELEKFEKILTELKSKKYTEMQEEFFKYLEIDSTNIYREKMKGYVCPTEFMNSADRDLEEIIKSIQKKKQEKLNRNIQIQKLNNLKELELKKQIRIDNEKIQMNYQRLKRKENKYSELLERDILLEKERPKDMSWKDFQDVNIDYFITNRDDDFNPKKYIEEYNLREEDNDSFIEKRVKNKVPNSGTSKSTINDRDNLPNKYNIHNESPTKIDQAKIFNKSLSQKKLLKSGDLEIRAKEFENNLGSIKENMIKIKDKIINKGLNKIKKYYKR